MFILEMQNPQNIQISCKNSMKENIIVDKNDMTLRVDLVGLKKVKDKDPKYLELLTPQLLYDIID
jgi:hypothetical protein